MTTTPPPTSGSCATRGRGFTTQAHHNPPRRYCSERCRKIAWRRRHAGAVARPDTVPRPADVPDPVPARPEPATRCPHCARPIAVISLLVTPAAAQLPARQPPP